MKCQGVSTWILRPSDRDISFRFRYGQVNHMCPNSVNENLDACNLLVAGKSERNISISI